MAVDYLRAALGVIADEVKRSPLAPGGVVCCLSAMAKERLQEFRGLLASRPGGGRSSDARVGESAFDTCYGVIVQLEIFFLSALPVKDIWFVPYFPIPGFGLFLSVFLRGVPRPLENQFTPLAVVLRRIGPADGIVFVRGPRNPTGTIGLGLGGQRLGHKTDFDERFRMRV